MGASRDDGEQPATVDEIRLGAGFSDEEREDVVSRLRKLDRRLKRFDEDAVDLEVSVKGRDTNEQHVVLEARVAGYERFVATSTEPQMRDALNEVRDEIWRQIDDAVNKRTSKARRG
ncbi:MAG: HPF/RaiA family ribosome-associated protein [Actinobacteria bacterium]|nr:HPF/RaiA family ribosome-associated protein [Actinomycetota bacterium]